MQFVCSSTTFESNPTALLLELSGRDSTGAISGTSSPQQAHATHHAEEQQGKRQGTAPLTLIYK